MEYKEKLQFAETAAEGLMNNKTIDQIELDLKEKGLYKSDIDQVIRTARKIIGEKFQPLIRAKLLAEEEIVGAREFEIVDRSTLENLIENELRVLQDLEKKKVNELLKMDTAPEEIFNQTDLRFYSKEKLVRHLDTFGDIQEKNSPSYRTAKIVGGILLIISGIGIGILMNRANLRLNRIVLAIIIGGIVILFSGLIKKENPYD